MDSVTRRRSLHGFSTLRRTPDEAVRNAPPNTVMTRPGPRRLSPTDNAGKDRQLAGVLVSDLASRLHSHSIAIFPVPVPFPLPTEALAKLHASRECCRPPQAERIAIRLFPDRGRNALIPRTLPVLATKYVH